MMHIRQTFKQLEKGDEHYEKLTDIVNNSEWGLSDKTHDEINSLKGQYKVAYVDNDGNVLYMLYMNEIVIDDLDLQQYPVDFDTNDVDKEVAVYMYDVLNDKCYQTQNNELNNLIGAYGDTYQVSRIPQIIQLTQQNKFVQVDLNGDTRYSDYDLGVEMYEYIREYFEVTSPNIQSKLDPYDIIDKQQYRAQLILADQYGFPMYVMVLLDNNVRNFNYLNGNSWNTQQEDVLNKLITWQEVKS